MAPRREDGFTLLELTAAMLVASLVVLAIASAVATVSQAWERGERRGIAYETSRVIMQRLGRELAALSSGPFGVEVDFTGDELTCGFTAVGPEGPRRLTLACAEHQLILTEICQRIASQDGHEIILADEVQTLVLAYYDPAKRAWVNMWSGRERSRPPSLVRIEVVSGERGHTHRLPALILPVYVGRRMTAVEVDPLD